MPSLGPWGVACARPAILDPPCSSTQCTTEGLPGMTSSDKIISLRSHLLSQSLNLDGWAVEIRRSTVDVGGNSSYSHCWITRKRRP